MRHFIKCPAMELKPECQRLYQSNEILELREHVIHEFRDKGCTKHLRIPFHQSGELNKDYILNVHWYRQTAYYDMEPHLRDRIFRQTIFATGEPKLLNMIPTTTTGL